MLAGGSQSIGPLRKKFSAVVGPNGSGIVEFVVHAILFESVLITMFLPQNGKEQYIPPCKVTCVKGLFAKNTG